MKSVFSICKIFLLCFFVIGIFSSCSNYLEFNGNKVPKYVTIHITGYDTTTGYLTMIDDSGDSAVDFKAWAGQHIRWKLSDPRHHAIDTLIAKAISKNPSDSVFSTSPEKKFWSKSWKAVIKEDPAIKSLAAMDSVVYYEYKIVWEENGTQHTFDPRIQIRF